MSKPTLHNPDKTAPAPQSLAREYSRRLTGIADPVKAAGARKYFKEEVLFLGISAPVLRELSGEVYQRVRKGWGVDEAVAFCDLMLRDTYHEVRALGILVFERYRKVLPRSVIASVENWLRDDRCDSWALVDLLCPKSVGMLLERFPDLVTKVKGWAKSPNRWVRRASIVSLLKLSRKPGCLGVIYDVARAHFRDRDDLIQKANGWLLREAGKADMSRLEVFLRRHGPAIPRTTLRYAIERFPEAKRRALLLATKH